MIVAQANRIIGVIRLTSCHTSINAHWYIYIYIYIYTYIHITFSFTEFVWPAWSLAVLPRRYDISWKDATDVNPATKMLCLGIFATMRDWNAWLAKQASAWNNGYKKKEKKESGVGCGRGRRRDIFYFSIVYHECRFLCLGISVILCAPPWLRVTVHVCDFFLADFHENSTDTWEFKFLY